MHPDRSRSRRAASDGPGEKMRIVTRPDFDGVVCAVLIQAAEGDRLPIAWVAPNDMQKGRVAIRTGDIVANLPYHPACSLWFDHHFSNRPQGPVKGLFRIAPSAAGLVFEYYRRRIAGDYRELVAAADKIDAADLSLEEIRHPEKHPYILLSMTIFSGAPDEEPYWNRLVRYLRELPLAQVLTQKDVQPRCAAVVDQNRIYAALLAEHTHVRQGVAITDFRALPGMPEGNRFLAYAMFPEAVVSVKIGFADAARQTLVVKVGHSIVTPGCRINAGQLLSQFEGGGHRGAGACRFDARKADDYLPRILETLFKNEPNDA